MRQGHSEYNWLIRVYKTEVTRLMQSLYRSHQLSRTLRNLYETGGTLQTTLTDKDADWMIVGWVNGCWVDKLNEWLLWIYINTILDYKLRDNLSTRFSEAGY